MYGYQKFILFCIFFNVGLMAIAQTKPGEPGLGDAAANATNPMAFVTKLQVQPNFTLKDDKARQLNLTTRIVQPTASIGLPFIKSKDPSKVYTLYRFEVPLIGQTYPSKPALDATGLSDMIILDLIVFKKKWGLLGAGPGLIIPTNNPQPISGGKWCAGFTGVALNNKTKGTQFGVLVQQYFSFAGSSNTASRNFMLFQPIYNKVLHNGFFYGISPIMNFDWENSNYSVPIIVTFGKAFAKNLSAFIGPQYMLTGTNKGDVTIQFQLNAMFPPTKK
jgi:hypothetical protein